MGANSNLPKKAEKRPGCRASSVRGNPGQHPQVVLPIALNGKKGVGFSDKAASVCRIKGGASLDSLTIVRPEKEA